MIFSVIEIETWKRCRRKWDLQSDNRQNLESIKLAAPLVLGTAIHETLALKTDEPTISHEEVLNTYKDKAILLIEEMEANYKDEVGAKISIDEATPVYEQLALGMTMIEAYNKFYQHALPPRYKAVKTEQRMIVAIPHTEHWECSNCHAIYAGLNPPDKCFNCDWVITFQPHYLRGTMDTLAQDVNTGMLYNLERKTYGNRPRIDKLQNDTQMIAYEWMLCQLFGWDNIGGTLYDGIWKRDPNTKYFKSHYKLDDLFLRHLFIHPREQLEEYQFYLTQIVKEMADACSRPHMIYYNRRWEGCYDCGMLQLCDAISRGEDIEEVINTYYRQRRDANQLQFADPEGE